MSKLSTSGDNSEIWSHAAVFREIHGARDVNTGSCLRKTENEVEQLVLKSPWHCLKSW